jgi:hypothetical protein
LANDIEIFAAGMMNIDVDLGLLEAVAIELVATGQSADEWPLKRLNIDPAELKEEISWRKTTRSWTSQAVPEQS